jgi:hypothetical protein
MGRIAGHGRDYATGNKGGHDEKRRDERGAACRAELRLSQHKIGQWFSSYRGGGTGGIVLAENTSFVWFCRLIPWPHFGPGLASLALPWPLRLTLDGAATIAPRHPYSVGEVALDVRERQEILKDFES